MSAMPQWFTVQQIANSIGMTVPGVRFKLKNFLCETRTKEHGKGVEYALKDLPKEIHEKLVAQYTQSVLQTLPAPITAPVPAVVRPAGHLRRAAVPAVGGDVAVFDGSSAADRAMAIARKVVVRKIEELVTKGCAGSVKKACHTLLDSARAGLLAPELVQNLKDARDLRGKPSRDGLPSTRAMEEWVALARAGDGLIPQKPQPSMKVYDWHTAVLDLKRRPQKPTNKWVHQKLMEVWDELNWGKPITIDQLNYFIREKVSKTDILRGQLTGSALAAKLAYQPRSAWGADGVEPFVECHADGWNTHFRVPHPTTGNFETLEIWHFHEIKTRFVTPPSVGKSESKDVILAGLENYIRECGVPAIWQTDSTGSVKNKSVEFDPVTSFAARAGITILHPVKVGNSQANGIAENFNTYLDRCSRELATYQNPKRMDSLAWKRVSKWTDAMVKAKKAGDIETAKDAKDMAEAAGKGIVIETFAQFMDWLQVCIDQYNDTPHSSLPKISDPVTGKRRHQTPRECREMFIQAGANRVMLNEAEIVDLFREHVKRTVVRGMVTGDGGQLYRHEALDAYLGENVMVAWDYMDGEVVYVKDMAGKQICIAKFVSSTGYRAKSTYEIVMEKRMQAQIKRQENKIVSIQERMDTRPVLEANASPALGNQAEKMDFVTLAYGQQAQESEAAEKETSRRNYLLELAAYQAEEEEEKRRNAL